MLHFPRSSRRGRVSAGRLGDAGDMLYEGLDRSVGWYWEMRAIQDAHPDAVLWQEYAEVIGDLPKSVGALARFVDVPLLGSVVDEIVSSCTVEAVKPQVDAHKRDLQQLIKSLRKREPRLAGQLLQQLGRGRDRAEMMFREARTLLSYNHISPFKGAVGIWKAHLDAETAQTIVTRYGDWYQDAYGDRPDVLEGSES